MGRRHSLLPALALPCLVLAIQSCASRQSQADPDLPRPTPAQLAWQEAELGVVFHYDLHVFDDKHYQQGDNRKTPIADPDIFNPYLLDTDQWVLTAKAMGARFAILTASHETGFRLWQSDANPYCLGAVRWGDGKRDIVAEFIASCRRFGLQPGIYMGTRWNAQLGVQDFKVTSRSPLTQARYNHLIEGEVAEICSRYGNLFELWFDGGAYGPEQGGPDVLSVFERYQRRGIFYHDHRRADTRWGGSESGRVPYPCWATMPFDGYSRFDHRLAKEGYALLKHGDPEGGVWCPAMSDAPLRQHEWFWDEGDDHKVRPLKDLLEMYFDSVGHNSTLILGLTPDRRGLIPDADVLRCREFGVAIAQAFAHRVGVTTGTGNRLELDLPGSPLIDKIVLQEDIARGERVRRYRIESHEGGRWVALAEGSCIGHKRIHRLAPRRTDRLRIQITASQATPLIQTFAVYGARDR